MEIGESSFWKNHGKLAHLQILAPKSFHGYWFSWFSSCLFLVFAFYVLRLGNWFGKDES